jgi:hypothetical protein
MKISDTFERVLEKPELHLAVISITRLRAYIDFEESQKLGQLINQDEWIPLL